MTTVGSRVTADREYERLARGSMVQVGKGVEIAMADVGIHFDQVVGIEALAGAKSCAKQVHVHRVVPHRGSISLTRHKLTLRYKSGFEGCNGDLLLTEIGHRLRSSCRTGAREVGRCGGQKVILSSERRVRI